ncbi:unnamed protein product [Aureobasidium uvarum]|uniref:Uncharacterized protein n=1 Tax=Aureobasidium uvarum TaxID=2773716 RepID=A0A9N8KTH0_9PEZI|nr:unnamed protein product [Aureobasidium uvarum]
MSRTMTSTSSHADMRAQACAVEEPLHGTISISLLSRGLAVGRCPRDSLGPITRKGLLAALNENDSRVTRDAGQTTITYNIWADERVVLFLAHWVHTYDATASLTASLKPKAGQSAEAVKEVLQHFHLVFNHFADMNTYNSDICDSLIDWYILWLRENKEKSLNLPFTTCMNNDRRGYGPLIRVCANVFVHHRGTLFKARNQVRFALWLDRHLEESVRDTIPGDILADDFDHFCSYHGHGKQVCYSQR